MMKKLCSLLALWSVATLLLVACGSSGSDSMASANQVHMSITKYEFDGCRAVRARLECTFSDRQ